jgi:hypothetical protein
MPRPYSDEAQTDGQATMNDALHSGFTPRADRAICDSISAAVSKLCGTHFALAEAVDIIQSADRESRRIPVDDVIRLLLATQRDVAGVTADLDRVQHGTHVLPMPLSLVEMAG